MRQLKSTKTVVRTYKTKKGMVTKTYTYSTKQLRVRKKYTINSTGKVNKASIKRIVERSMTSPDETKHISEGQVRAKIAEYQGRGMASVSEQRIEASILHNRIEGMFANAGYTVEEAASEAGVTVEQLLDPTLWTGDIFSAPGSKGGKGKDWRFVFRYHGSVWEPVSSTNAHE